MSVRKACQFGARATCKYGDQRCDHSWKARVKHQGTRYPDVDVDTYAFERGAPAHVRTEREALTWEAKIAIDWVAGRDPRIAPNKAEQDARTIAELLAEYQAVALRRLNVHPPVISEVKHLREYFERHALRVADFGNEKVAADFMAALTEGWRPDGKEPLEDGRGLAAVNRIMARFRNFVNWAMAQQATPAILTHSPFHAHGIVIRTSDETVRARRLHAGEEAKLIKACKAVNDLDHQWAGGALLRRILGGLEVGGRGSELDRVTTDHIDWVKWEITLTGKSGLPRVLSIDPRGALAAVLKPRRFLKGVHAFVFGDENGDVVNHRTGWETVVLLAHGKIRADGAGRTPEQAALDYLAIDLHFHDLRRECASRWYFVDKQDIVRVSRWLGHSSVLMTQRYLALPLDNQQGADMATQLGHTKTQKRALTRP